MTEVVIQREVVPDALNGFRMDDQIVVVTGASSGLGAHFTRVLHGAGATVIAAARRTDRLAALTRNLDRATGVTVDLATSEGREQLISSVIAEKGRIDVLVNNAGRSIPASAVNESVEDFREVLELNVTATWHLAKLTAEFMLRAGQRGAIVNVASIFGHVASAPLDSASYAASKGAVVNLTRELAAQWAASGIRVNALCPGFFPSELTADLLEDSRSAAFIERMTPMRRVGSLEELDGALLLLSSGAGRYITGTSLLVDGGWAAR